MCGLGVMYENGQGVHQSYVEAYKWHSLYAASGHKYGKRLCGELVKKDER